MTGKGEWAKSSIESPLVFKILLLSYQIGRYLVGRSYGNAINIWKDPLGEEAEPVGIIRNTVSFHVGAASSALFVAQNNNLTNYDLKTAQPVTSFLNHLLGVRQYIVSDDNKKLFSVQSHGGKWDIWIWDISEKKHDLSKEQWQTIVEGITTQKHTPYSQARPRLSFEEWEKKRKTMNGILGIFDEASLVIK